MSTGGFWMASSSEMPNGILDRHLHILLLLLLLSLW
jgi:hypothetical protein